MSNDSDWAKLRAYFLIDFFLLFFSDPEMKQQRQRKDESFHLYYLTSRDGKYICVNTWSNVIERRWILRGINKCEKQMRIYCYSTVIPLKCSRIYTCHGSKKNSKILWHISRYISKFLGQDLFFFFLFFHNIIRKKLKI